MPTHTPLNVETIDVPAWRRDLVYVPAEFLPYVREILPEIAGESLSYGELFEIQTALESLAERFPTLHDEFRENGLI